MHTYFGRHLAELRKSILVNFQVLSVFCVFSHALSCGKKSSCDSQQKLRF